MQHTTQKAKNYKFVQLVKLQDLWTDDADWQRNVAQNAKDGWTLDSEDNDTTTHCISTMQKVKGVQVYDFMGSEYEQEAFYEKRIQVYKAADGTLWVKYNSRLYDI